MKATQKIDGLFITLADLADFMSEQEDCDPSLQLGIADYPARTVSWDDLSKDTKTITWFFAIYNNGRVHDFVNQSLLPDRIMFSNPEKYAGGISECQISLWLSDSSLTTTKDKLTSLFSRIRTRVSSRTERAQIVLHATGKRYPCKVSPAALEKFRIGNKPYSWLGPSRKVGKITSKLLLRDEEFDFG